MRAKSDAKECKTYQQPFLLEHMWFCVQTPSLAAFKSALEVGGMAYSSSLKALTSPPKLSASPLTPRAG